MGLIACLKLCREGDRRIGVKDEKFGRYGSGSSVTFITGKLSLAARRTVFLRSGNGSMLASGTELIRCGMKREAAEWMGTGTGGGLGGVGEASSFSDDPSTTSMTCLFPFLVRLKNTFSGRSNFNGLFRERSERDSGYSIM